MLFRSPVDELPFRFSKIISLAIDYNFEQVLTKAVYDFLEKRNGSSSNGAGSYLNSFWSSAIVSVIFKWVKDGMKTPAEKIAKLGLPLFPQKKKTKFGNLFCWGLHAILDPFENY